MNLPLPEWLNDYELDPGLGAYDAINPALRAHLKSQIATLYELWAAKAGPGGSFYHLSKSGLFTREKKPLDWALFVLDENYASPSGFIAALLPALMAGVGQPIICRSGHNKNTALHPAISAALELLGREEIFALPPDACSALADELFGLSPLGCVVALGGSCAGATLLPATVKIALDAATPDMDLLAWLHPGALIEPLALNKHYDAVITTKPGSAPAYSAPLVLGPSYAYFWQWPSLNPAFFQHQIISLT